MNIFTQTTVLYLVTVYCTVTVSYDDSETPSRQCQTLLRSVMVEVTPTMLHTLCRDNSSVTLVVTCANNVWSDTIGGYCRSNDVSIGEALMDQLLLSSSVALQLTKSGKILDSAKVKIIISEHLLNYRISVWGTHNTRFVLAIARECSRPSNHGLAVIPSDAPQAHRDHASQRQFHMYTKNQPYTSTFNPSSSHGQSGVSDKTHGSPVYFRTSKIDRNSNSSNSNFRSEGTLKNTRKPQKYFSSKRTATEMEIRRHNLPSPDGVEKSLRSADYNLSETVLRNNQEQKASLPTNLDLASRWWRKENNAVLDKSFSTETSDSKLTNSTNRDQSENDVSVRKASNSQSIKGHPRNALTDNVTLVQSRSDYLHPFDEDPFVSPTTNKGTGQIFSRNGTDQFRRSKSIQLKSRMRDILLDSVNQVQQLPGKHGQFQIRQLKNSRILLQQTDHKNILGLKPSTHSSLSVNGSTIWPVFEADDRYVEDVSINKKRSADIHNTVVNNEIPDHSDYDSHSTTTTTTSETSPPRTQRTSTTPSETPPPTIQQTSNKISETPPTIQQTFTITSETPPPTIQQTSNKISETPPTIQQTFTITSETPLPTIQQTSNKISETPPTIQLTSNKISETPPTIQQTFTITSETPPPTIQQTYNTTSETPLPTTQQTSTITSETPTTQQTSTITSETPTTQQTSTITSETPTTQQTSTITSETPTTQQTSTITSETPTTQQTSTITSETPTTQQTSTITSETPTTQQTSTITSETPTTQQTSTITSETPTIQQTSTITSETPTTQQTSTITSETPTTQQTSTITSETPTIQQTSAITSETPTTQQTSTITSETPTIQQTSAITSETPTTQQSSTITSETPPPTIQQPSTTTSETPPPTTLQTTTTNTITRETPTIQQTSTITSETPTTQQTSTITSETPTTQQTSTITSETPTTQQTSTTSKTPTTQQTSTTTNETPTTQKTSATTSQTPSTQQTSTTASVTPPSTQQTSDTTNNTPPQTQQTSATTYETSSLTQQTSATTNETSQTQHLSDLSTTSTTPQSSDTSSASNDTQSGLNDQTLWPVVAALVIGIPAIIVLIIAITMIHRKRQRSPSKFFNMTTLNSSSQSSFSIPRHGSSQFSQATV